MNDPVVIPESTTLSAGERAVLEDALRELEGEMETLVELSTRFIPEPLAGRIESVLFEVSPALPARTSPPNRYPITIVDQLARSQELSTGTRRDLLATCLVIGEGIDVMDDLADGDVRTEDTSSIFVIEQAVLAQVFRLAGRLDDGAPEYCIGHVFDLAKSYGLEEIRSPSFDAYLDILDYQAAQFSLMTGLVGVITDVSEQRQQTFESIGTTYYKYAQVLRDLEEVMETVGTVSPTDPSPSPTWIAWLLADEKTVEGKLEDWQESIHESTADLPAKPRTTIRGLVSVDIDAYRGELGE